MHFIGNIILDVLNAVAGILFVIFVVRVEWHMLLNWLRDITSD
jgi:hypothetical protein